METVSIIYAHSARLAASGASGKREDLNCWAMIHPTCHCIQVC